jgi:GH43 family beta-xylosidase
MTAWISRVGDVARKTIDTLGRATREQTSSVTGSTSSLGREMSNGDLSRDRFVNPIAEGADPSVVRVGDRFLWCQAEGNVGVSIWVSDRLTSMGTKHVVWTADAEGPCSKEVWAPELHMIDGRWHIYFAASDGENRNHRTYALVSDTDDPIGSYSLHGPLFTGDEPGGDNLWAIDFTVLQHHGRLFGLWSGWPDLDTDLQHLYAAEMSSPTEIKTGRVRLLEAGTFDWQRVDETPRTRGLIEGPRVFQPADGQVFVTYTCAASWLPTYKVGLLGLTGDDPLDPEAWHAYDRPVFESSPETFGAGHGSFVDLEGQWWYVFHSKVYPTDGWQRTLHVQPVDVASSGAPVMGAPRARGADLPVPTGQPWTPRSDRAAWDFRQVGVDDFDYYGHHQFFAVSDAGLDLGCVPAEPVNDFRSAEKFVLRDGDYENVKIELTVDLLDAQRSVGVLFRTTAPSIGFDTQRGYYACFSLDTHDLVLGRTDGEEWTTLATEKLQVRRDRTQTMTITAEGDHLRVTCSGAAVDTHDDHYRRGSVGMRVVECHARYLTLSVTPL